MSDLRQQPQTPQHIGKHTYTAARVHTFTVSQVEFFYAAVLLKVTTSVCGLIQFYNVFCFKFSTFFSASSQ